MTNIYRSKLPFCVMAKIAINTLWRATLHVTATQAKNRFGAMCALAKTEPVFVEKDGRIDSVIVSAKQFADLQAASRTETLAQRKAQFELSHSAWIAEQNQRFDAHGLWCDDMRVW